MRGWAIAAAAGGVVVLGAAGWWLYDVQSAKTGDPGIDDALARASFELARIGLLAPKHLRALASIFHNEHSRGGVDDLVHDVLEVGDVDAPGGPSIGRGQNYRSTAISLGLWPSIPGMSLQEQLADDDDRNAYAAFGADPANDGELIRWAAVTYKSKLAIAGGDVPTAIRLYNGAGPSAEAYKSNALAFADDKFGEGAFA